MKKQRTITLIDQENGESSQWTVEAILAWLNSDRNDEWKPYTKKDWRNGLEHFGHPYRIAENVKIKSPIKIACEYYLGNRGITQAVKRCARFEDVWFIVFEEAPADVEISLACGIYECYEILPSKGFKWNKANYKAIKNGMGKY